jgi:hypothetical protein
MVRDLLTAGDEQIWMTMIRSRNVTSHTYNPPLAHDIATLIVGRYVEAFQRLVAAMESRAEQRSTAGRYVMTPTSPPAHWIRFSTSWNRSRGWRGSCSTAPGPWVVNGRVRCGSLSQGART